MKHSNDYTVTSFKELPDLGKIDLLHVVTFTAPSSNMIIGNYTFVSTKAWVELLGS